MSTTKIETFKHFNFNKHKHAIWEIIWNRAICCAKTTMSTANYYQHDVFNGPQKPFIKLENYLKCRIWFWYENKKLHYVTTFVYISGNFRTISIFVIALILTASGGKRKKHKCQKLKKYIVKVYTLHDLLFT